MLRTEWGHSITGHGFVFPFFCFSTPHTEKTKLCFPSQIAEIYISVFHVVCFIHSLNKYFLTTYHDPDTVLILGDTKMKDGLVPPMNIADIENCQHSKHDECQTKIDTGARGKLQ